MRTYTVKGKEHEVYDLQSEVPEGITIVTDWKNSRDGDWVLADDGAIIQVLERKKIGESPVVVTCIGTYSIRGKLDTAERANRLTLSGRDPYEVFKSRKKATMRETRFAKRIKFGEDPVEAYMAIYNAKSISYAKRRSALLLKTQRIINVMDQDLKDTFSDIGVDLVYLLQQAKDECDNSKNGSDRLKALQMLWDAWGVVKQAKVTEVAGLFQGFQPAQIEEIKRPELPGRPSNGDETL